MFIPLNTAAYSPNTMNSGAPKQANQTAGRGFFTAPERSSQGKLLRAVSLTFADVWSQPRLFFNSLLPVEQQFVINAVRFETSQLKSDVVKSNVLIQLNRVSHDIAVRVASALGMTAPEADSTYYHDNTTAGVSVTKDGLLKLDGFKVGYLTSASVSANSSASALKSALKAANVSLVVVAEKLGAGIDQTYAATDASQFDALVIADSANALFTASNNLANSNSTSSTGRNATASSFATLYPAGRPMQILQDGYRWGKPVAAVGSASAAFKAAGIEAGTPGVYGGSDMGALGDALKKGLMTFKFLDRYPLDA
jgi:catalase